MTFVFEQGISMTAIKLFKRITLVICFLGATLFLSSCTKTTNSNPQNVSTGEEYGTSDYGWR